MMPKCLDEQEQEWRKEDARAEELEELRARVEELETDRKEYIRLLFTTKLPTCGDMTILQFAEKVGAQEAMAVLFRQYGWDASLPNKD